VLDTARFHLPVETPYLVNAALRQRRDRIAPTISIAPRSDDTSERARIDTLTTRVATVLLLCVFEGYQYYLANCSLRGSGPTPAINDSKACGSIKHAGFVRDVISPNALPADSKITVVPLHNVRSAINDLLEACADHIEFAPSALHDFYGTCIRQLHREPTWIGFGAFSAPSGSPSWSKTQQISASFFS
jgi:hypothetical protein